MNTKTRIMSANEFEKQVHDKMSGWKLEPGQQVWTEVEKRIRREKKRRRFLWLIFLFLLTGAGLGTIQWINRADPSEKQFIQAGSNSPGNDQPIKNTVTTGDTKQNIIENKTILKEEDKPENENNNEKPLVVSTLKPVAKKTSPDVISVVDNSDNANDPNKRLVRNIPVKQDQNQSKQKEPLNISPRKDIPDTTSIAMVDNRIERDSMIAKVPDDKKDTTSIQPTGITKKEEIILPAQVEKTTPDPVVKKEKKNSKLDWGVSVQTGISSYVDGLRLFGGRAYELAFQSPQPTNPVPQVSPVKPGFSFGVALLASQQVSPRLVVTYGLGYSYLSTRIKVGNRVDSSINNTGITLGSADYFYRANSATRSISNQFHLFDLSVELSWKLSAHKKFSLYWDNSIHYNGLFASRVFQYDRQIPGYYKNSSLLTHHHFFYSTGLSIPASKKVTLSPFISYSLTPVYRNSGDSAAHFLNYGLRLKFALGKRK